MSVDLQKVERKKPKPPLPGSNEELHDFLMAHGFADLNDPALIHQLAFFVKDDQHFKEIIQACKPDKRHDCYEQMRPYLRFQAKPFYEYLLI